MRNAEAINLIHDSLMNGQRRQMCDQIDEHFIPSDFWSLYLEFLRTTYEEGESVLSYFSDAVISYSRIRGR